jgi:hypothetical protein
MKFGRGILNKNCPVSARFFQIGSVTVILKGALGEIWYRLSLRRDIREIQFFVTIVQQLNAFPVFSTSFVPLRKTRLRRCTKMYRSTVKFVKSARWKPWFLGTGYGFLPVVTFVVRFVGNLVQHI